MNEQQMSKRCPNAHMLGQGLLKNYRLDFTISAPERWNGGGCADVVSAEGSEVYGLLYEVNSADEASLDNAEGPRYKKVYASIANKEGKSVKAFFYDVIDKAPFKKPSAQYLDPIKKAAIKYQFPPAYLTFLNSIETTD